MMRPSISLMGRGILSVSMLAFSSGASLTWAQSVHPIGDLRQRRSAESVNVDPRGWHGTIDQLEATLRSLGTKEAQAKWLRSIGATPLTSFEDLKGNDLFVVLPVEGLIWIAEPSPFGFLWARNISGLFRFFSDYRIWGITHPLRLGWQIFRLPHRPGILARAREAIQSLRQETKEDFTLQMWQQKSVTAVMLDSFRPFLESLRWIDASTGQQHRLHLYRHFSFGWPVIHNLLESGEFEIDYRPDTHPGEVITYVLSLLPLDMVDQVQTRWDQLSRANQKALPLPGKLAEGLFESTGAFGQRLQDRLKPVWQTVTRWIEGQRSQRWWHDSTPRRFEVVLGIEQLPIVPNELQKEKWDLNYLTAFNLQDTQGRSVTVFYVHPKANPYTFFRYAVAVIRDFAEGTPPGPNIPYEAKESVEFHRRSSRWQKEWMPAHEKLIKKLPPGSMNDLALEALRLGGAEGVFALAHALVGVQPIASNRMNGLFSHEFVNLAGRQAPFSELKEGDFLLEGYLVGMPWLWLVGEQNDEGLLFKAIRGDSDLRRPLEEAKSGLQSPVGKYRLLATREELQQMIASGDLTEGLVATWLLGPPAAPQTRPRSRQSLEQAL